MDSSNLTGDHTGNVTREGRIGALVLGIVIGIVLVIVGVFKMLF
ncbi:MAG TPA: hypothetical protein VEL07_09455 [Planctomycetota bacterium]|nr:hypothetical protein [Planctomycetota bacterium]